MHGSAISTKGTNIHTDGAWRVIVGSRAQPAASAGLSLRRSRTIYWRRVKAGRFAVPGNVIRCSGASKCGSLHTGAPPIWIPRFAGTAAY